MGLCSCKDGVLVATDTAYVCRSDSSPEKKCSFRLGKNMLSHVITITELESLATTGKTPVIDDFVSKRTRRNFQRPSRSTKRAEYPSNSQRKSARAGNSPRTPLGIGKADFSEQKKGGAQKRSAFLAFPDYAPPASGK